MAVRLPLRPAIVQVKAVLVVHTVFVQVVLNAESLAPKITHEILFQA